MEVKKCSKCDEIKDVCLFSKNNKSKDKLRCSCKECDKEKYFKNREHNIARMREYKKNNPEKLKEYYLENQEKYKQYRESKKDVMKSYLKDYYQNNLKKRKEYNVKNLEIIKEKRKEYNEKNSEIIAEKRKEYYDKNKEKLSIYNKEYRKNNIEKEIDRYKKFYEKNREDLICKSVESSLKKRREIPIERLKHNVRNRIVSFIKKKDIKKTNTTFEIVGCSPQHLKSHLEQRFVDNMSWDNQGQWHIDHIIPLASAKSEEELYKLYHFTNLQPMWAVDNIKKGSKILQ